jgi:hypothetical protein
LTKIRQKVYNIFDFKNFFNHFAGGDDETGLLIHLFPGFGEKNAQKNTGGQYHTLLSYYNGYYKSMIKAVDTSTN